MDLLKRQREDGEYTMRILTLTTLYPSAARPFHGIFVENRLRAVKARGHDIRVVAPVPWFPSSASLFGAYGKFAATPTNENRHGLPVSHPRYPLVPKIGMTLAADSLARCFHQAIQRHIDDGFVPDLIDAHYYYPDAVAAARAAAHFDLPVVATARGTDINLIPTYPRQRRMVLDTAAKVAASICVADALRDEMISLGADGQKIHTIRNGVDLSLFTPGDREAAKQNFGVSERVIASVGHLIERKGHHLIIDALPQLADTHLLIAGTGPEEAALKQQAERVGVRQRVHFLGPVPHEALPDVYRAADILVLASSREGWPNVLLEAMACGTPCVATPVWGSGEVIAAPAAGRLAGARTSDALVEAITMLTASRPDRAATRQYAEQFGWAPVAEKVEQVWTEAAASKPKLTRRAGWGRKAATAPGATRAILTVDTEEIFDWKSGYSDWQVPPVDALHRLQAVAEKNGFKPLYFTTYPLLNDDEVGGTLAKWAMAGRADIGLHLHNWCTPPIIDKTEDASSFQCNIDPALHEQKLSTLIEMFTRRVGQPPVAHRAGRYGIAPWVLDQLAARGVMYDFSPSAGFDFRPGQGPDFFNFGTSPRQRETAWGTQWVIPVSGVRKWRRLEHYPALPGIPDGPARAAMNMATLPVRLTPEGHTAAQLTNVARHLVGRGMPILTPSLHITSIVPGATPYAPDDAGVERILSTLDDWMSWAVSDGVVPAGLGDIIEQLARSDA
ncbi:glycosyltransferase [Parvularcula sp. LCG005]|uniref:glycosyltransferase n=1 Tax=Parvularcula sp. LCG005 TaxID=3078805 RepID=UPI0029436FEB|nr:glycosyltransferase [Parvularcula sp. LCG005]WOI52531.1 glycosyltransferase [Parvularcula sp. LCG005]